jgi:Autotransporter beta-domain
LSYVPNQANVRSITNSDVFRLSGNSNSAEFNLDLLLAFADSPAGEPGQSRNDLDIWLTGKVDILGDSSAANRDGYLGNISFGIAKRIRENLAIAAEITGRVGELNVNASQSTTDVTAGGFVLSAVTAITPRIQAGVSGAYERRHFESNFAGATGSYNSDTFTYSGFLDGLFHVGKMVLQPSLSIAYSHTNIGGYTDSNSIVVRSQSTEYGQAETGLAVSRVIPGRGRLYYWQPYINGRLNFAFEQISNFLLNPNILVRDGRYSGSVGAGAQLQFTNGLTGTISASQQGAFGTGINVTSFAARLAIPLN